MQTARSTDEMPPSAEVIRVDFERIACAASDAPDRLEPAARRLLAEVPLRSRVLEIGCGTGAFSRELASKRGARVTAIDHAPRLIEAARMRTHATLGIDYRVADFMELSPRGFEVVVAIDTLHELPFADALERMANAVLPGGRVLIVDRTPPSGFVAGLLGRPLAPIRANLRIAMPDVSVRRHGAYYTAIWCKPSARP